MACRDGCDRSSTHPDSHNHPSAHDSASDPADAFPLPDGTSQFNRPSQTFSTADHSTLTHSEPGSQPNTPPHGDLYANRATAAGAPGIADDPHLSVR